MFLSADSLLCIRPIEKDDLDFLLALRSHQSTWENLGDIDMPTKKKQLEWFEHLGSRERYFIIENVLTDASFVPIGMVRCDQIDWINQSVRVGADLCPEFRGKGLGKKTYRLLLKYCFDYLNLHRVWLSVIDTNKIAYGLYQSIGFVVEGRHREGIFRNGQYHDYIIMSILRPEYKELSDAAL